MKLSEVKQYTKKDKSATFYMSLQRKLGLYAAWIIINIFPSISANFVTISMLPLNILAAGFLYYAVVAPSYIFLIVSVFISFIAFTLDCTDGNIARIKKSASIKGVFLDRLVHNISNPLFFFVLGFALYVNSDHIIYVILFMIVGLLSELSPIDVSQKDVEALFIRQAVFQSTINYDLTTHRVRKSHATNSQRNTIKKKIIKTLLENDMFYLMIVLDMLLFKHEYYLTSILGLVYIIGNIYIKSNIKQWEMDLNEVLERLSGVKH